MNDGWVIHALDRVHARLVEAEAWPELRLLSRMSDSELIALAEQEVADPHPQVTEVGRPRTRAGMAA